MPILEFPLDLPGVTRGALWEFHRDPAALERLTPPEKKIRVVERPKEMYAGARVVLSVRQFGLWLTWISLIETWEPETRFVDVQEKGPFASWRHEHLFFEGRLLDRVTYEVPLAMVGGRLADRALVRPELERMFAHRHRVTAAALRPVA
ncbi:MAG: SRPBCC family protein [Acidobacteriota bacterium]|nr:SRPBCC family protein [Acidobacteriota bacterium]